MLLAAALMLAGPAASGDGDLAPASEAAILAGMKACIGATVDPAEQDARLAGWPSVIGNDPDTAKDGVARRVASKDNVRLVVKTGVDGGCVVQARGDAAFDEATFYRDLSAAVGVPVVTDPKKPVTNLPNGEMLVTQVAGSTGKIFVELVVANPNGKYAKQSKGN